MSTIKLPRVSKSSLYTTGDDQKWTYQYTWEDWNAVLNNPSSDWYCDYVALYLFLLDYFIEHPEYIQDHECFKTYSLNDIQLYMKYQKNDIHYSPKQISDLNKLWEEMIAYTNK